jgi:hypothetical protein
MKAFLGALGALILGCALAATPALAQSAERGEHVFATMQTAVTSKTANVGDKFTMTVNEPYPGGLDLAGATILGHVSKVVQVKGPSPRST